MSNICSNGITRQPAYCGRYSGGERHNDDCRHAGRRSATRRPRHTRHLGSSRREHLAWEYAGAGRGTAGKKTKTLELTLTVTGTADGEWRAELKQGTSYLARNLAVAAAAVSRAAKELHEDLSNPIDEVIEEARSQQAARVAALEAELDAARKALADLDSAP
jgi:hypothetical protein